MNPNLNKAKLARLVTYLEDGGSPSATKVANQLKAKPENRPFLREYVEAAAELLEDPSLLTEFDKPEVVADTTPTKPPVEEDQEIQSTPEPAPAAAPEPAPRKLEEVVVGETPVKASAQIPGGTGNLSYIYLGEDGIAKPLTVKTNKDGRIVLVDTPVSTWVTMQLNGAHAQLDLAQLRALKPDSQLTVNGRAYPVSTLLLIAEAA